MELTVLGSCGTYPVAGRACSGYLLRRDGYTLWMDAGNGTLAKAQEHVAIEQIDAVYLSHTHVDHCADIFPFFYRLLILGREVPVFAPPETRERLATMASSVRFGTNLRWVEMDDGDKAQAGPFEIGVRPARHTVPSNIARITAGGRTLTYSGDTAPCDALVEAAEDADLFLCEASWLTVGEEGPIHSTAEQAGAAARAARAKRLMLTHVWPHLDHELIRAAAEQAYGAPVELASQTGGTQV